MLSGPKKITAQKTKKKRKRKRKRQQKQNANSTGRSYSAPKPVWELLLVRQLQIILGEKLFGPQARLRITPIAWFEPATSMTSLALVAREQKEKWTKNWKKRYQRGILAYVVMADGLARWGSLNTTIRTLLKEVINCVHWLSFDLCITVNKRKFVT